MNLFLYLLFNIYKISTRSLEITTIVLLHILSIRTTTTKSSKNSYYFIRKEGFYLIGSVINSGKSVVDKRLLFKTNFDNSSKRVN
jgi:hypothetical protein